MIDSGVDLQHPDINGHLWQNPGEVAGDGIDQDGNGKTDDVSGWDFTGTGDNDPDDVFGHGTNVAGVIGAETNNSMDIAAAAWNVAVMSLRNGTSAPDSAATIAAINYVVDLKLRRGINVPVINISSEFGGADVDEVALSVAVDAAAAANIIVVVAAGNSGVDLDDPTTPIVYPAELGQNNVITVAATEQDDSLADFDGDGTDDSNFGVSVVDIAAPGDDIVTLQNGGSTISRDGTSFAAPLTAAVVALLYSAKPEASYLDIRNWLLNGADTTVTPVNSVADNRRLNANGALAEAGITSGFIKNAAVDGTTGNDTILVEPNGSNVRIKLNGATLFDEPAGNVRTISINGLAGADTITVDSTLSERVIINGGAGNDSITAGVGADILAGGRDSDTITGGLGNDVLLGMGQADSLYGSGGDDLLAGDGTGASAGDLIQGDNGIDTADYSGYSAAIVASNDDVANDGTSGVETDNIGFTTENISGGAGNDSLTGAHNDNVLNGNGGNDTITGNAGNDNMLGGNGDDRFRAEDGLVDTVNGGNGSDLFILISGTDYNVDRTSEGDPVNDIVSSVT